MKGRQFKIEILTDYNFFNVVGNFFCFISNLFERYTKLNKTVYVSVYIAD